MYVEDMKRWHWMLIAVAVGLGLSYVWSKVELGDSRPTMSQFDFERGVIMQPDNPGYIANIIVLPTTEKNVQAVRCAQLRRTKDPRSLEHCPALFLAPIPFKSARDGRSYPTMGAYLDQVKPTGSSRVRFKYAWYRQTWVVYGLWTGASVVLIGLVWPSVVSLMTGGGLGLMPQKQIDVEYDLSRFGNGQSAPSIPGASDPEEFWGLDEELEQRLASDASSPNSSAVAAPAPTSDQCVRPLEGGPLETQIQKPDEPMEYGGEFYPVAKPHK